MDNAGIACLREEVKQRKIVIQRLYEEMAKQQEIVDQYSIRIARAEVALKEVETAIDYLLKHEDAQKL